MPSSKPPPSETEPSGRDVKPHDALFRRAFSDVKNATGELRHVLPSALVEEVDWSTLRALETSVLDAELRELCSDLVFSVEVGGSEVLLYVLVEHQSRSDPMMGFRMLRYMVRLWDKWHAEHGGTRLPAIVPVVVHHGARAWSAPLDFAELVDLPEGAMAAVEELMPRFRYLVDDLATQAVEAIAARKVTDYAVLVLVSRSGAAHVRSAG
ncbi:MAG: Rpn family recombination-promoting nuclease/putative transposase [Polyangiaceae bacterium]